MPSTTFIVRGIDRASLLKMLDLPARTQVHDINGQEIQDGDQRPIVSVGYEEDPNSPGKPNPDRVL